MTAPKVIRVRDGRIYLLVCPRCGKTNPVLAIPSGVCHDPKCGYVAEDKDVEK